MVTPFAEDGSVNYDKLDELIDYHCEHGTDSIIICGTTENLLLYRKKNIWSASACGRTYQERLPVIAKCPNATYTTIGYVERSRVWRRRISSGDNVHIITKATQDGLIAHYKAVARKQRPDHYV